VKEEGMNGITQQFEAVQRMMLVPRSAALALEREAASRRFAGMTQAPKSKPASTKLRYWRVSVPGGKRPEYVGIVEAPDQQSAEATAVKRFRLTDEERERLVVRTRRD
jgi:hypothetical protein